MKRTAGDCGVQRTDPYLTGTVTEEKRKIDQAKDKILRDANEKARAILQEAKDVADETIRDFNKAGASADIKELEKRDRRSVTRSMRRTESWLLVIHKRNLLIRRPWIRRN